MSTALTVERPRAISRPCTCETLSRQPLEPTRQELTGPPNPLDEVVAVAVADCSPTSGPSVTIRHDTDWEVTR